MKISSKSRSLSFVKQVQVDLLALGETDLFHTVHCWVDEGDAGASPGEVPEETRSALGYTRLQDGSLQWHPPSPSQLRLLLGAMDVKLFAQHVLPLAFRALHPIHPHWYEGLTFNAHLAHHLRQMKSHQ
jgi:hypothetical protein